MILDIPNLQNVHLPDAFKNVINPIVNSIQFYILKYDLDVSELLYPKTHNLSSILSIDTSITSINIPDWTYTDIQDSILEFSQFTNVESIEIGNNCFGSVQTFRIEGLNRLKTIKIGNNTYLHTKYGNDESKSFHILNCESLESIEIGEYSFSDFAGDFELRNLPQLQSIQIGHINSLSYNFLNSSFVIRGINMILTIVMIRSSKSTIHYFRWFCIFCFHINNNRKYE